MWRLKMPLELDSDYRRAVEDYENRKIMNEITGRGYNEFRNRMSDDDRAYEARSDKEFLDRIRNNRSTYQRPEDYR